MITRLNFKKQMSLKKGLLFSVIGGVNLHDTAVYKHYCIYEEGRRGNIG